jgi:hypothetical protein
VFAKRLPDLPPPVRYRPGKPEIPVMDPYRDTALAYEHPGS